MRNPQVTNSVKLGDSTDHFVLNRAYATKNLYESDDQ